MSWIGALQDLNKASQTMSKHALRVSMQCTDMCRMRAGDHVVQVELKIRNS